MEKTIWRLIKTPPLRGSLNMAIDEALLEKIADPDSIPALRLYAWTPPCLSLGFSQPITDVDLARVNTLGYDLVRRPTGGRAVLHTDEMTYSVIAPLSEPRVKGSVIESYRRLSLALVNALNSLSLEAVADKEYNLPQNTNKRAAVCFEVPSNYEITVKGKKLIGSAQARKHKGVLQHGSLPLHGDLTRIIEVLNFSNADEKQAAKTRLLQHATTIEQGIDTKISWNKAAQAFIQSFQETLNIEFFDSALSDQEMERAITLQKEKYNSSEWINHN